MPKPFDEDDELAGTQRKGELPTMAAARFDVEVVAGPDQGVRAVLQAPSVTRILVGSGPVCEVRLRDRRVSRRHAALQLIDGRVRIEDLESTNGTWVQGVEIVQGWLRGGETFQLGDDVMRITRSDAAATAPPTLRVDHFGGLRGASEAVRRLFPLCQKLAASMVPAVIEGETGTGKEVLAEALHAAGPRASAPFVVFDCTTVPPAMMEAELFGHERGAFTGAVQRQAGVFEQAHGGTLFIDEIGDLDLALQPKLLRAIERGEFRRIGGRDVLKVDVRILAATRRNLDREVELGRFRDDLFHRLAVGRIELPPLRDRHGDVRLLALAFTSELGGTPADLPEAVLARWDESRWVGNVRELRNAVARYLALGVDATSGPSSSSALQHGAGVGAVAERVVAEGLPLVQARQQVVDAFEIKYLEAMLARHGGVVTQAAQAAGIARRHFQRLRARPR